jgi:hypothetical protein
VGDVGDVLSEVLCEVLCAGGPGNPASPFSIALAAFCILTCSRRIYLSFIIKNDEKK